MVKTFGRYQVPSTENVKTSVFKVIMIKGVTVIYIKFIKLSNNILKNKYLFKFNWKK